MATVYKFGTNGWAINVQHQSKSGQGYVIGRGTKYNPLYLKNSKYKKSEFDKNRMV